MKLANPDYDMSIEKCQAIQKSAKDLKSNPWLITKPSNELRHLDVLHGADCHE